MRRCIAISKGGLWRPIQTLLHTGSRSLVRRHPLGAAVSVAVTIVLTTVSLGLVRQYQRAELEREKAEEVSRFLVGLFERTDPGSPASDTLTVKAVLAEGAARVADELRQQPLVQASVMNAIGEAYMGLGTFEEAQRLMTSALRCGEGSFRRIIPTSERVITIWGSC